MASKQSEEDFQGRIFKNFCAFLHSLDLFNSFYIFYFWKPCPITRPIFNSVAYLSNTLARPHNVISLDVWLLIKVYLRIKKVIIN